MNLAEKIPKESNKAEKPLFLSDLISLLREYEKDLRKHNDPIHKSISGNPLSYGDTVRMSKLRVMDFADFLNWLSEREGK